MTNSRANLPHTFTIRIWNEDLGDGKSEWRGKVQSVNSREARYFRSEELLFGFLREQLAKPKFLQEGDPMSVAHIQQSIAGVIQYLSEHPDECRYTDKAATVIVEEGLRCHAESPNGAIVISDMPKAIGGGDSAPSPGWLLRAALANCDATVIAMRAAQVGVTLTTLQVTVDSESDDRGLLGMDDTIPAGPLSMRVRVRIGAKGAAPERLREIVEWAEAHSPVSDAVRRGVPSGTEVEIA